jgi:hypothetical protein
MKVLQRLFLICVLGAFGTCQIAMGQQPDQSQREIVSLIARLSWDSIGGNCERLGASCPEGDAAIKLVRIGKPATDELLKVLNDQEKGVAAHVVLTAIWEPGAASTTRFGSGGIIATSNGLEWEQRFTKNGFWYRVGRNALSRNAARWRQKISGYRSSNLKAAG